MLTPMDIDGDNIIAYTASGKVTDADYKETFIPAIQAAMGLHKNVCVLMHFGPEFDSYTVQAIFDDAVLGVKYIKRFERIAVVTDNKWFAQGIKFGAHLMPFAMCAFDESELAAAKKWIID